MRTGHDFDVYTFGDEGSIIIGRTRIPYEKGLLVYSDGDVALHVLTDALPGVAALGGIGKLFPNTNLTLKGAGGRELLREAWRRIQARGYTFSNINVITVIRAPEILPHIPQMCISIAKDLGYHTDGVNVRATTAEKLDFIGRGEGIACETVTLLHKVEK